MDFKKLWEKVKKKCEEFDEDPAHVMAIILAESYGDPLKDSGEARGLMQISRIALRDVNKIYGTHYVYDDLFDPRVNLEVGLRFLKLTKRRIRRLGYEPDIIAVGIAWNYGYGNLKKWLRLPPDNAVIDEFIPAETWKHYTDVEWYYQQLKKDPSLRWLTRRRRGGDVDE